MAFLRVPKRSNNILQRLTAVRALTVGPAATSLTLSPGTQLQHTHTTHTHYRSDTGKAAAHTHRPVVDSRAAFAAWLSTSRTIARACCDNTHNCTHEAKSSTVSPHDITHLRLAWLGGGCGGLFQAGGFLNTAKHTTHPLTLRWRLYEKCAHLLLGHEGAEVAAAGVRAAAALHALRGEELHAAGGRPIKILEN